MSSHVFFVFFFFRDKVFPHVMHMWSNIWYRQSVLVSVSDINYNNFFQLYMVCAVINGQKNQKQMLLFKTNTFNYSMLTRSLWQKVFDNQTKTTRQVTAVNLETKKRKRKKRKCITLVFVNVYIFVLLFLVSFLIHCFHGFHCSFFCTATFCPSLFFMLFLFLRLFFFWFFCFFVSFSSSFFGFVFHQSTQ